MFARPGFSIFLTMCAVVAACGISSATCTINTAILPANATAEHNAAAPGNQVQFSLSSTVDGNCPLIPDIRGEWSTSDPANTAINSKGLATCLGATAEPVTISNSGVVRGHRYPSATLECK